MSKFIHFFYIYFVIVCNDLVLTMRFDNYTFLENNMLTLQELKTWLKNETDKQLPKENPYCNICCMSRNTAIFAKVCGIHTMCIYKENKTGPECTGYIKIKFTEVEKKVIVDAHNTLRNRVANGEETRGLKGPQPRAANMRVLEWDDELAAVAERWAAQCLIAHDECRDVGRFPIGQSIAVGNFATNNQLSFIKNWYDMVEWFDPADVKSYKPHQADLYSASQYTQIVWANTYLIGCARAIFQKSSVKNAGYMEEFVCNYGPTGNIPGLPVYLEGQACSNCPIGSDCSRMYSALCARGKIDDLPRHEGKQGKPRSTDRFKNLGQSNFNGIKSLHNSKIRLLYIILFICYSYIFR